MTLRPFVPLLPPGTAATPRPTTQLWRQDFTWFLAAVVFLALALGALRYPLSLIGTKARISNITDPGQLSLPRLPDAPPLQPDPSKLLVLRVQIAPFLRPGMTPLEKIAAIRHWSRLQQAGHWGENDLSHPDPLLLLDRQRRGIPGNCSRFAFTFAGALEAAGFTARVVNATEFIVDPTMEHTLVEVWLPDRKQWALMDSMYDTAYLIDGQPASLYQVAAAVHRGQPVTFDRAGSNTLPVPNATLTEPRLFQHLLYSRSGTTLASDDHPWWRRRPDYAHFSPSGKLYPESLKRTLLIATALCLGASACLALALLGRIVRRLRPLSLAWTLQPRCWEFTLCVRLPRRRSRRQPRDLMPVARPRGQQATSA